MNRRLLLLAPLGAAVVAGGGFFAMLRGMEAGSFDPRKIPSPLIGKKMPPFTLPGLSSADLAGYKAPVLVNFFASWCEPCTVEAPALMDLKRQGVTLIGIAYKDHAPDTARFIARHGDPYTVMTEDAAGRVAIDWGVTGVPETFLVDPSGVIRWHFADPLSAQTIADDVDPLLKRYA